MSKKHEHLFVHAGYMDGTRTYECLECHAFAYDMPSVMTCPACRNTGMARTYDPDDTYPCGCDLGDPYRTRGELALRHLFDAFKETT